MNKTDYLKTFVSDNYKLVTAHTFTPEDSQFILENFNTWNRLDISTKKLEEIKTGLLSGKWDSKTGNMIRFRKDGVVMDGQHRFMACVQTGIPFTTSLALGMEKDSMAHIDDVNGRKLHQNVLLLNSKKGVQLDKNLFKSARKFIEIAKVWIWALSDFKNPFYGGASEMSDFLIEKQKFLNKVVIIGINTVPTKRAGFQAACAVFMEENPEKGQKFFDEVTGDGTGFYTGSPTNCLRNYFIKNPSLGSSSTQKKDFLITMKAIQVFVKGEKVFKLTYRNVDGY